MSSLRIGVDSGGTFTDVCMLEEDTGRFSVWKLSSTPNDPSVAIANGAAEVISRDSNDDASVVFFGHGTTVATNALIQGRGARCGLITSDGFRDLLDLARQRRPHLYDLQTEKPAALVPRDRRFEVNQRILFDGTVEREPSEEEVRSVARQLREEGAEAVAVCFLYSFVDKTHETKVTNILSEELGETFLTTSHEVCPEFREFERLSTTVVNAFLGPVMKGYLSRLTPRLVEAGVDAPPFITQSNGGTITFETAARLPVRTVLSGPSTGVIGAVETARAVDLKNIITFDMGGTSTDVSLVENGIPRTTTEAEVHGYPIKSPMIDIHTVGAGGGSIAHIDTGGFLKVGPRSAGADPGPVCYGLGNDEPTVTDANVVMGVLNGEALLGGRMKIDREASMAAIEKMGAQLGLSVEETAAGVIRVVTANMTRAIRLISVQRGHDPRDYCLMPFGGGGPVHAGRLARELAMERILVPRNPGILCALGLLLTDIRRDFSVTRRLSVENANLLTIHETVAGLVSDAMAWFEVEAIEACRRRTMASADMRYAGQNYELNVPIPDPENSDVFLEHLVDNFNQAYQRQYDYTAPEEAIEIVTFRVEAYGLVEKPAFQEYTEEGPDASSALVTHRFVYQPEMGEFIDSPVYDRDRLRAGNIIAGPAVIEQMDSTTLLLPGQTCQVDTHSNLMIREDTPR
ncbi:MAG: hydantoinase/oxoprolinase family protein [Alphaproteobacteria bacterium]|jgi:N-methylhydantoinase A|nr:hydantoinase/oxoprolinase family protein [Alphaproteobacteria bacterium]